MESKRKGKLYVHVKLLALCRLERPEEEVEERFMMGMSLLGLMIKAGAFVVGAAREEEMRAMRGRMMVVVNCILEMCGCREDVVVRFGDLD